MITQYDRPASPVVVTVVVRADDDDGNDGGEVMDVVRAMRMGQVY